MAVALSPKDPGAGAGGLPVFPMPPREGVGGTLEVVVGGPIPLEVTKPPLAVVDVTAVVVVVVVDVSAGPKIPLGAPSSLAMLRITSPF